MSVQTKRQQKRKESKTGRVALAINAGENSNWAYVPPPGFTVVDHGVDCAELDWDAIRDDEDTELWLVKAPEEVCSGYNVENCLPFDIFFFSSPEVKPKYLERLQLDAPRSSRNSFIGTLSRKTTVHDVWSIGGNEESPVGGEEMSGLLCLLPRQRKGGRLYKGVPVARFLSLPDTKETYSSESYKPTHHHSPTARQHRPQCGRFCSALSQRASILLS
jgi:hypothetical protein